MSDENRGGGAGEAPLAAQHCTSPEATGRIRIIVVPEGEAPEWVRWAWLNLILPCHPYLGFPENGFDRGVITGKMVYPNSCGVSVPQGEAIEILEAASPANISAVDWWRQHGFPKQGEYFCFKESEFEIISGVSRQVISRFPSEEGPFAHDWVRG